MVYIYKGSHGHRKVLYLICSGEGPKPSKQQKEINSCLFRTEGNFSVSGSFKINEFTEVLRCCSKSLFELKRFMLHNKIEKRDHFQFFFLFCHLVIFEKKFYQVRNFVVFVKHWKLYFVVRSCFFELGDRIRFVSKNFEFILEVKRLK